MEQEQQTNEPDYIDDQDDKVRIGWHIEDVGALDWALFRLAQLKKEIEENNALTEAAIYRLKSRTEMLNARVRRGVEFFEGRIREYAAAHRDELLGGGKKKSRTLPHGVIAWRKSGAGFKMKDDEALLEWAQDQPVERNFVRYKETPAWDVIKAYCEATGEVPPGVVHEDGEDKLAVEPVAPEIINGSH